MIPFIPLLLGTSMTQTTYFARSLPRPARREPDRDGERCGVFPDEVDGKAAAERDAREWVGDLDGRFEPVAEHARETRDLVNIGPAPAADADPGHV